MPKVFIIQDPGLNRDFSSAVEYGSLYFLLEKNERPSYDPRPVYRRLLERLRTSFSEEDYIVWAGGDPMAPVLVGQALRELGRNSFKNLRWERVRENGKRTGDGYYVPVSMDLS